MPLTGLQLVQPVHIPSHLRLAEPTSPLSTRPALNNGSCSPESSPEDPTQRTAPRLPLHRPRKGVSSVQGHQAPPIHHIHPGSPAQRTRGLRPAPGRPHARHPGQAAAVRDRGPRRHTAPALHHSGRLRAPPSHMGPRQIWRLQSPRSRHPDLRVSQDEQAGRPCGGGDGRVLADAPHSPGSAQPESPARCAPPLPGKCVLGRACGC